MLLVTNLLGIGFGPTAVALVSDFVTAGTDLGLAIAIVGTPASIVSAAVILLSLKAYRNAIDRLEERTA